MIKVKNVLIAAAALASVSVPNLAYAGKIGQSIKYFRDQLHNTRDQKHQLKADFKSGNLNISRALYRQLMHQYTADIQDYMDKVDQYQASR